MSIFFIASRFDSASSQILNCRDDSVLRRHHCDLQYERGRAGRGHREKSLGESCDESVHMRLRLNESIRTPTDCAEGHFTTNGLSHRLLSKA
jgi:hypothetical protein